MTIGTIARPRGAAATRFRLTFHFAMALLMAAVTVYGFSQTFAQSLIRPAFAPPTILYVHALLFSSWIALYVLQTGLVAAREVRLHRRLGPAWLVIGAVMPVIGVLTAIAMRRFHFVTEHRPLPFLAVPLWDMLIFTPLFVLAVVWRRRPEFHRRLMFLATCNLMDAAFARLPLPDGYFHSGGFYAVMDCLVIAAIVRDLVVQGRVHIAYAVTLPIMIAGQSIAWFLWRHPPAAWLEICRTLVGVG
jgi:hypothetical protein